VAFSNIWFVPEEKSNAISVVDYPALYILESANIWEIFFKVAADFFKNSDPILVSPIVDISLKA
jgi:hypothetical protein